MPIRREDVDSGRVFCKRYRNRRIGEFLKDLRITEGRNTGLRKIQAAMQANGSPKPEFDWGGDERAYFVTTLRVHPIFSENSPGLISRPAAKTNLFGNAN